MGGGVGRGWRVCPRPGRTSIVGSMWFRVLVAVIAAVVMLRIGFALLRGLGAPPPEPPPPGQLRKVRLEYRCAVCGTELRMTSAPDEEPPPPKHCLEDMELVAPID